MMPFLTHANSTPFKSLLHQVQKQYTLPKIPPSTQKIGGVTFDNAQFEIKDRTFRLVLENNKTLTLSSKSKTDVAFSIVQKWDFPSKNIFENIRSKIDELIRDPHLGTPIADIKGSIFEEPIDKQSDVITTANVLSWNRLLNDAYQGNSLASGAANSSDASELGDSGMEEATSMAKMMNQCGGNSKSNYAHREAMKGIAQALVMSKVNAHDVARASESYADQSKDYKRNNQESVLDQLAKMQKVDQAQLHRNLQTEKRKIMQALQQNQLHLAFEQNETDQASQKLLQAVIDQQGLGKTTTLFDQSTKTILVDPAYFELFSKQPDRTVHFDFNKKAWVINPLLDSAILWRKALVECLWKWPHK